MRSLFKYSLLILAVCQFNHMQATAQQTTRPLRLAVVGATHGHVPWILGRRGKEDVQLVGVYEPDTALSQRLVKSYKLDSKLFYTRLNRMLQEVKPEAVVAFGSIYDHLAAVEACAPLGIHVMVEKPLAVSNEHAQRMAALARKHRIHLLTNFETSWYPTTEHTARLVHDSNLVGGIRKAVFHHGHQGPKKIRVNPEFFSWLTDPVQNGGGALVDFGCYGANIMTWLMKGEVPLSVTAVTQNFQKDIYPKVDDEATIIVQYPKAQCIIQASWNWPFNRKDMEVYGADGAIITTDHTQMRIRRPGARTEEALQVTTADVAVYTDPFSYFADVIRGKIQVPPYSLYSLENNLIVVRILDAARRSARTGKTVMLE